MVVLMISLLLFALLFPAALLMCRKKKMQSMDQIKPQKQPTAPTATTNTTTSATGGQQQPPMPQREADDMETVDGCKSEWGKVQDAPKV